MTNADLTQVKRHTAIAYGVAICTERGKGKNVRQGKMKSDHNSNMQVIYLYMVIKTQESKMLITHYAAEHTALF